jgi:hypothetical protein
MNNNFFTLAWHRPRLSHSICWVHSPPSSSTDCQLNLSTEISQQILYMFAEISAAQKAIFCLLSFDLENCTHFSVHFTWFSCLIWLNPPIQFTVPVRPVPPSAEQLNLSTEISPQRQSIFAEISAVQNKFHKGVKAVMHSCRGRVNNI